MKKSIRYQATAFLFIILSFSNGCINLDPVADSTNFYVLGTAVDQVAKSGKQTVLVRNLDLSDYLKNSQIAQREGANKVTYLANHRWAGSLDQMIVGIVAEEISLNSTGNFATTLATGSENLLLDLKIVQFDFSSGKTTTLVMEYVVIDPKTRTQVHHDWVRIQKALDADATYEEIVYSLEQTLRAAIREISI